MTNKKSNSSRLFSVGAWQRAQIWEANCPGDIIPLTGVAVEIWPTGKHGRVGPLEPPNFQARRVSSKQILKPTNSFSVLIPSRCVWGDLILTSDTS